MNSMENKITIHRGSHQIGGCVTEIRTGNRRMEILHTSGHAYVETIAKLIRLTNPKVIIPMHTECAKEFGKIPAFAPYRERVKVVEDGEGYCF